MVNVMTVNGSSKFCSTGEPRASDDEMALSLPARSFYARYESRKQRFAAWSAEAGKPFRDELWRGIGSIASQIVRQIPPPPPPSSPGALVGAGEF